MMRALRRNAKDERGAVLVITVAVMLSLVVIVAYAIDTGVWFVHSRHLQTEADAAALAAAQDFQYPCDTTIDAAVIQRVHQYDGTGLTTFASSPSVPSPYNQQVAVTPTASVTPVPGQHNLVSLVNSPNFAGQSLPGDTNSQGNPLSDPCTDGAIDVKMTETNLPSFFPFINPSYLNRQAEVQFEQVNAQSGAEPLAIPNVSPKNMSATLVDESSGTPVATFPLTTTDSQTWTSSLTSVTFPTGTNPIDLGLRVRMDNGSAAPCTYSGTVNATTGVSCYDSGSTNGGIAYTRDYAPASSINFPQQTPPDMGDTSVASATTNPTGTVGCPSAPTGTFSNFISSASCNVTVSATFNFGTGATCASVAATQGTVQVKSGTTTYPMSCPAAGPNGPWTTDPIPVAYSGSTGGPIPLSIDWNRTSGNQYSWEQGGTSQNKCSNSKACTYHFGQQVVFMGAYDASTSTTSRSGPIFAATLTDQFGTEIMSAKQGSSQMLRVTIRSISGFQNATSIASPEVALHAAGSQGTYAIACTGNNGSSTFDTQMQYGCSTEFATTDQPNPPICSNQPPGPAVCVTQNPGTGKNVEPGLNARINGSANATKCTGYNYWTAPNTIPQILAQKPPDPRLISLLIVDNGAWNGVSGTATQTPIRFLATFYVTGWYGDPCITQPGGINNGLTYTHDDPPAASGILLGHFVKYVVPNPNTTPSNVSCQQNTFGNCVPVLVK